ncbi:MAG TPA: EamA/RhaT family transporter [Alphaproteobacteria bacterium]|nr:EamA/RhaT family transporter [Alphaproteobacteria bacterium]
MPADLMTWLWAPITIFAAFTQTLRNAAQRHLTKELGTLGATLVRFLYGLPFAIAWLAVVALAGSHVPEPNGPFLIWVTAGAAGQIFATALLLRAMEERNFAIGVAYSKTEIIQVAVFSIVLLGDPLSLAAALAILIGSIGVTLLSPQIDKMNLAAFAKGWTTPAALFGIASGSCFAISAVGYRGAALSVGAENAFIAAAYTLVWAQALQTLALGGWIAWRNMRTIHAVIRAWRWSLAAGACGAFASAGWFTAMTLEPAAHVRTLGLVEVLFSYLISLRLFRERLSALEITGLALLVLGVALITLRA